MMGIFKPTVLRRQVQQLSPGLLRELSVRAVLLDVDNTIAPYGVHKPAPGTAEWVQELTGEGFRVVIVSNNYKKRVGSFAALLELPWISFALKPLPFGYLRARRMLGVRCRECAVVGDQIFTDIVGANLCGMRSVLLEPLEPEEGLSFRVRRHFEKGLRRKFKERKDVIQ